MENVLIIEWWHWVLGGLGLVLLELALPSFYDPGSAWARCWSD